MNDLYTDFYCYEDNGQIHVNEAEPVGFEERAYCKVVPAPNQRIAAAMYEIDLKTQKQREK